MQPGPLSPPAEGHAVPNVNRTTEVEPCNHNDPVVALFGRKPLSSTLLPLFVDIPSIDIVLPTLLLAIKNAKNMPSAPPASWQSGTLDAWNGHLQYLTGVLADAVRSPTPINLFNAVVQFCCAPGLVLAPLLIKRKRDGGPRDSGPIQAALRKIKQGQERKAFKLLCSNGVANVDEKVVEVLRDMHPKLDVPLVLPQISTAQVQVEYGPVFDRLFRDAADSSIARDVYGWAPSLFYHIRGVTGGFLHELANFIVLLTNRPLSFPQATSKILAAGYLTPLHKLPAFEQRDREMLQLPPKIRPINSGTLLAKVSLGAMLASPAAEAAVARTQPYQLSLGTKRGVEKLAHTCRAAYHKSYLIGRNDFANDFNSLSRQKMLDAQSTLFPEGSALMRFFYGDSSPVYLIDENDEMIEMSSEQGSRQGCAAGCLGFCLTTVKIMQRLQSKYEEYQFRAVVDDIIPLVPPPISRTFDEWQRTYIRYAQFLVDLKQFAQEEAGLCLNVEKGGILLPEDAPEPTDAVKAIFPEGFEFQRDRIGGAPIGTMLFVQKYVSTRVAEAIGKINQKVLLGKASARAAHRLLTSCATKLLTFLASTVPPNLCAPSLLHYDNALQAAFLKVIGFEPESCSRQRYDRALLHMALPAPNGRNLFKVHDFAAVSWFSSVAHCLSDPLLYKLRHGLDIYAQPAFECLQAALGGNDSQHWTRIAHVFPTDADGLLNGDLYSPLSPTHTKFTRIVLRALVDFRLSYYRFLTGPAMVDELAYTSADLVQVAARTEVFFFFFFFFQNSKFC